MIYEIQNKNNTVRIANSMAGVSRYFKENKVRGFSARTLKKTLKQGVEQMTKQGYTITRVHKRNKIKADIKFRKATYNTFTNSKRAMTQSLSFNSEIVLNEATKYDLIDSIIEKLNSLGQTHLKTHKVMVVLKNEEGKSHATKFLSYNNVIEDVKRIANYIITQYHNNGSFNRVDIVSLNTGNVFQNVVFGTKITRDGSVEDQPKDDKTDIFNNTWKSLKWIKRNMKLTQQGNKQLFNLCKEYYIYKPSTFKCCLIQAVYTSLLLNKTKANYATKNYMKQFKDEEIVFTPDNILPNLTLKIQKSIMCYYLDEDVKSKLYAYNDDSEQVKIIIIGTHAHALLPKAECDKLLKEENLDTDTKAIQEDKKKVLDLKNIKKAIKEAELNADLIKKPKQKKPSELKICTYDLETCDSTRDRNKKHDTTVYALGFYDGGNQEGSPTVPYYKEIYKRDHDNVLETFVRFLESYNESIILYAHNGGKFDTFLLLKQLLKMQDVGKVENLLDSGGRLMSLDFFFWKTKKTIQIRDSLNLIPLSLDGACKAFQPNTVKLEGDVDHDKINIENCTSQEIYEYTNQYLMNDCVSLHEILVTFNNIMEERFNFSIKDVLTNAGMARKIFLEKFYEDNIYNLSDEADADIRKYFQGGRNEVMTKLGYSSGKFYYVDFTSLYPYAMKSNKYPYGKVEKLVVNTTSFNRDWFGFVKCKFRNTHKNNIPLHAVFKDGKLMFPYADSWQESILSTEEIRYSLENDIGYEYQFEYVYNYKLKDSIFEECVDYIYKMKIEAQLDGNAGLRQIAKIIINSFYGFWAIRYNDRNQKVLIKETPDRNKNKQVIRSADQKRQARFAEYLFSQRLKNYKQVNGYDVYDIVGTIKAGCANVGIGSMIASNARLELYKLLKDIKDKGGKIFYMDTDSVVTDYNLYADEEMCKKWIRSGGDELGELTNETDQEGGYYTEMVTLGNKMYALKNDELKKEKCRRVVKLKGINSKMKFDYKRIDFRNKTITFSNRNKFTGKYKLEFDDYVLMDNGFKLIMDNMNFVSGINEMVIKDKGLTKLENQKVIRQLYDKAEVYQKEVTVSGQTYQGYSKAIRPWCF